MSALADDIGRSVSGPRDIVPFVGECQGQEPVAQAIGKFIEMLLVRAIYVGLVMFSDNQGVTVMSQLSYCFTLLGCLLVSMSVAAPAQVQPNDVVVGVNLDMTPDSQSVSWQETTLNNLQDARVRVIRTGIANNDQGVDF